MGPASSISGHRRLTAAIVLALAVPTAYVSARPAASLGSAATETMRAAVRTVRRIPTALGDRIVIELTREATFDSGRLAEPERIFFDFTDTDLDPALAARAAKVTGVLVKSLRVARHDASTRVVLDLHGQPRYRFYPLLDPFRVVIEVESSSADQGVTLADGVVGSVGVAPAVDIGNAEAAIPLIDRPRGENVAPATVSYVGSFSTFTLEKPAQSRAVAADASTISSRPILPARHESVRARAGLGYVQGADWGAELQASGSVAGVRLQADGLITRGPAGLAAERGLVMLSDPDRHWRFEAGDVFSYLTGASRGARLALQGPAGLRPAIAVVTPRQSYGSRPVIVSYRDQLRWRGQTLLDAEVGSDRSLYASSRLSFGRLDAELTYRSLRRPDRRLTDRGLALGLEFWRGAAMHASIVRTDDALGRSDWLLAGVRVPVVRWFEIGIDRTFVSTPETSTVSSAVTAGVLTNRLRLSHRYQRGETGLHFGDISRSIAREQYQTMTTWTPGPRLSATLQLVTAWNDHGRAQSWEEFQATVAVTRRTSFSVATPVQPRGNHDRLRLHLMQQLPKGFALAADYGRVSPFQPLSGDSGRPRARLMLSRMFAVATPSRGGLVAGRILDHVGQPVAGARVVLGQYAMTTGPSGEYVFSPLPAGPYELRVDEGQLPANYAWDGRRLRLDVTLYSRWTIDLGVTPLNAIHGRVFVDRNSNNRFDLDEGVAAVVVRLGDRVTTTDAQGAYSFYNVWPGDHAVVLDVARLPETVVPGDRVRIDLVLADDRPATGADFVVRPKVKPIKWGGGGQ